MSFARSLFTVSGFTVISRVTGFVRDTLTAMILGAGPVADAFFVAQRLPSLFRTLFAEGAFSAAFVPIYAAERQKNGLAAAQRFAGEAMTLLLAVLLPFSILMMIFMPLVIRAIAPGFSDEPGKYELAIDFGIITFPYLALISVAALQGGVLNAKGKFAAAAAAPISLNIVMIAALFLAHIFHFQPGYTLSWAFMLSGIIQMMWLASSCKRAGVPIFFTSPRAGALTKKLFRTVGPGAIGAGAVQINIMLSTILASTLPTGVVSCLSYADRLNQLPLGIVGIAVATTLLPVLARHVESGNDDGARHYMSRALEFSFILGLPAAIGLGIAAKPIVRTLFEHGAFTSQDTVITAEALAAYAVGIPAYLLIRALSTAFFARHNTKTPVKISLFTMLTNIVCALLLIGPLEHIGIALAGSIAAWADAALLYINLRRQKIRLTDDKLRTRLPRVLICAAIMSIATMVLTNYAENRFIDRHLGTEMLELTVIIGISALVYGFLLQITGAWRWRDMLAVIRRENKPVVPEPGSVD